VLAVAVAAASASAQSTDFNRDVLPVLTANCLECHGPDAAARQAELRLDERDSALAERDGSPAIVPGRPEQSAVVARITSADPDERMPPKETGRKLSAEQIRTLRDWIEQGARYSEHWAFLPPAPPPLPEVGDPTWCDSPVDRFVHNRLEQTGFRLASPGSRETLIRRATLDLLGLPPSPDEVDAFLAERSPDAFERLTDRLLIGGLVVATFYTLLFVPVMYSLLRRQAPQFETDAGASPQAQQQGGVA
jgi:mono/diheme cytochrome c family protein